MQMIADIAARTTDGAKATFYPDHLLPALQSTLAVLADLDIRHEINRDYLEEWSGPDEVRRHLVAELEAEWQRAREPLVLRLAELQGQMRTPACVTEAGPRGSQSSVFREHDRRHCASIIPLAESPVA
jgi:hypothetical protein